MQVLYPNDLKDRKMQRMRMERTRRRKRLGVRFSSLFVALVVLLGGIGVFSVSRSVQAVQPSLVPVQSDAIAPLSLSWPNQGQAAIGAVGYGVLDQHASDKPVPTASTAKIFTALMIMKAKPLASGQQGPLISVTAEDEAVYQKYIAQQGSVYPVTAGQQISEYEALRALLLPSANNIADMLVVWAYGSMDAYVSAANQELKTLGLTNTTVADASGFGAQTVSTAHDLTLAGILLMQDPVLAAIVGTTEFELPGIGTVHNTNVLLGGNGVVGIKTGHTDEAGGCFVVAVKTKIDDTHDVIVVSTALGAADVASAMKTTVQLSTDARLGFGRKTLVDAGQVVAEYHPSWGGAATATAKQDLTGVVWLPSETQSRVAVNPVSIGIATGTEVGTIEATFGSEIVAVPVIMTSDIPSVPISWRLYKRYL